MNRLRPFFSVTKNDDRPDCYKRVRYIRDCCKVFSDLTRNEKDFFIRSIDGEISKSFKEFRQSDVGKDYRSIDGQSPSILNQMIDEFIEIHEFIDLKRKSSAEQIKKLIEQAREKQSTIRQTINELKDNYDKAQRKLETADTNLKKFQTRPDRLGLANFDERCRELEDIRCECEQNRTITRDQYQSEIYQYANEEYSIAMNIFAQYLFEQNLFYQDISKYFTTKIPFIESKLNDSDFIPIFGCDLIKHCSKRSETKLAYPIEICIRLLENNLKEEGLFRIGSSISKQKKFVNELNLQLIDKSMTLNELSYDPHVIANTLKQYLRELPNCLLTTSLYSQWNQLIHLSDEQKRLQRIEQLLHQLPSIHYENLCYLVRFLSRVVKYSTENKMTANNLSICIGGSLLFLKDQQFSMNQTSLSNNYTNGSLILELLINHHEDLFPMNSMERNVKIQPDLIPTEFYTKSRSYINETHLENPAIPIVIQPSPGTRRKAKAPPPPPSNSSIIQTRQRIFQEKSSENEEHPRTRISINTSASTLEETDQKKFSFGNLQRRLTTGISSIHLNLNEKHHRRTASTGFSSDRPTAPPPLPPSTMFITESNPSHENILLNRESNLLTEESIKDEENLSQIESKEKEESDFNDSILNRKEEINLSEEDQLNPIHSSNPMISNESFNVGQVIAQFNHRTAQINNSTSKTKFNDIQRNRRYSSSSSYGPSTTNSPGETTDF